MNAPATNSDLATLAAAAGGWQASEKDPGRGWTRFLARTILVVLLYYLLVVLSLKLRLSTSTLALLWPSNALLVATLALSSRRHWWIYLAAVIPAHVVALSAYHPGPLWEMYQITANSVLAITCAALLQHFAVQELHFETLKTVLIFIAIAIVVPGVIGFAAIYPVIKFMPSAVLYAHGWSKDVNAIWLGRWITNSASFIVFLPTMLVCVAYGRSMFRGSSWKRVVEGLLLGVSLATVSYQVYGHVYANTDVPPTVFLIPLPFLLWAAVRFGPIGACLSITALVCISSWCAYLGAGPFLRSISIDRVTVLQMLWIMISVPVLCLAAATRERKVAVAASLDSEERFRHLFNAVPIGIALEDLDGKLLFANPALASMLGYTQEELTNMHCTQFADAEDEEEDWKSFQKMLSGAIRSYQLEKRYRRKDGARIWGRLNVTLLNSVGKPIRVLATVEDITEKRAALQELTLAHSELQQLTPRLISAQEEEKRRIARELHDDLGQRLSVLVMKLSVVEQSIPVARAREHAEIRKLMGELDELVTDVHNMSHHLHSSVLERLGLRTALRQVCRQLTTPDITINLSESDVPHTLPEHVSLCFYRVAQEALANAVKHSGTSRIDVSLGYSRHVLSMRIRDFGIGFDPMIRASGLGLVTMHERLKMIGGVFRINSIPGGGTEVEAEARIDDAGRTFEAA